MIVKKYRAILRAIDNEIEGVYTLTFSADRGVFKFAPGQFLHLALDKNYDGAGQWPESRCLSIQTPPGRGTLKVTYAVNGIFTRQMEEQLRVGEAFWLKLPYGDLFTQEHNRDKTVFIAGGTGITPYLSLFTSPSFTTYENPVLYAGFRSANFDVYEEELTEALTINSSLTLNRVYQDEHGILDINRILEEQGKVATYFISGPPVMIKNFKQHLTQNGVAPHNVLTDDWE